jgi:hypothetical protein
LSKIDCGLASAPYTPRRQSGQHIDQLRYLHVGIRSQDVTKINTRREKLPLQPFVCLERYLTPCQALNIGSLNKLFQRLVIGFVEELSINNKWATDKYIQTVRMESQDRKHQENRAPQKRNRVPRSCEACRVRK